MSKASELLKHGIGAMPWGQKMASKWAMDILRYVYRKHAHKEGKDG